MIVTGASNTTPLVIDSEGPCDPHLSESPY